MDKEIEELKNNIAKLLSRDEKGVINNQVLGGLIEDFIHDIKKKNLLKMSLEAGIFDYIRSSQVTHSFLFVKIWGKLLQKQYAVDKRHAEWAARAWLYILDKVNTLDNLESMENKTSFIKTLGKRWTSFIKTLGKRWTSFIKTLGKLSKKIKRQKINIYKLFTWLGLLIILELWFYYWVGYIFFYKRHGITITKYLDANTPLIHSLYQFSLMLLAQFSSIGMFFLVPEVAVIILISQYHHTCSFNKIHKVDVKTLFIISLSTGFLFTSYSLSRLTFPLLHISDLFYTLVFIYIKYIGIFLTLFMLVILLSRCFSSRHRGTLRLSEYISYKGMVVGLPLLAFFHVYNGTIVFRWPDIQNMLSKFMLFLPYIMFGHSNNSVILNLLHMSIGKLFYIVTQLAWIYTVLFLLPVMLLNDFLSFFLKHYRSVIYNIKIYWISTLLATIGGSLRLVEAAQSNISGINSFIFFAVYYFFTILLVATVMVTTLSIYEALR